MSKGLLARPAALALILANFIPLWGVIFRGWDVANILHVYWAENVVFGAVTILKLLTNGHPKTTFQEKVSLAVFFSLHYGLFCYGHATFVFGSFVVPGGESEAGAYLVSHWFLVLGFLASHLVSYFYYYLGKGEGKRMELGKVMMLPYGRIVVLHVTIVIGGLAVAAMGNTTFLVAVLVVAKTAGDLILHFREHRAP